jgi:DNA polymerase-1
MDYGGTEYGMSKGLGVSKETALQYIDNYYTKFHGLAEYYKRQLRQARKDGFVWTYGKRKRHLPTLSHDDSSVRGKAERQLKNSPIQGSAGDIMTYAQFRLYDDVVLRSIGCKMMLQIYDEVVFECPARFKTMAMERIQYLMENALEEPLELPLPVGIDFSFESYAGAK